MRSNISCFTTPTGLLGLTGDAYSSELLAKLCDAQPLSFKDSVYFWIRLDVGFQFLNNSGIFEIVIDTF